MCWLKSRKLRPPRQIDLGPSADEHEVELVAAVGRLRPDLAALDPRIDPGGRQMQAEILKTAHPLKRIAGRRLVEGIHLYHRFPALGVVQIGEMMQEAGELHPAKWIDGRDRMTPGEQGYFGGAMFKCGGRVVEGGCAGPQHAYLPARQLVEINPLSRVGVAVAWQVLLDQRGY